MALVNDTHLSVSLHVWACSHGSQVLTAQYDMDTYMARLFGGEG